MKFPLSWLREFVDIDVDTEVLQKKLFSVGFEVDEIAQVDGDIIFDISLTANRPDCGSIFGMAREIAAMLGKKINLPACDYKTTEVDLKDLLSVENKSTDLCSRYMATMVRDIKIAPSPEIIAKRLTLCGHGVHNNIVDITNYILLELGNPMHAFDYDKLSDSKIIVRNFSDNEKFVALDEKEYTTNQSMLAICDGQKPVAIAGVMGGEFSAISDSTKNIVFEVASFARDSIRKTSRSLGLISDSSFRFEKGVYPDSCDMATNRALHLISKYGFGNIAQGKIDLLSAPMTKSTVVAPLSKIEQILGISVPKADIVKILQDLSFEVIDNGDSLTLSVPLYRQDVEGVADIAEEVIRYYGFEHIIGTLLPNASMTNGGKNLYQKKFDKVKRTMSYLGFYECVTYSFINAKWYSMSKLPEYAETSLKLVNPLSEDLAVMRKVLFPSLISVAKTNINKKNNQARFFEVARSFAPSGENELPIETEHLCFVAYGQQEDFYTLKGCVEELLDQFKVDYTFARGSAPYLHIGISADIIYNGEVLGSFGQLDGSVAKNFDVRQKLFVCELDMTKMLQLSGDNFNYQNIPQYQAVLRDLCFVLDKGVEAGDIIATIKSSAGELLESVEVFDVYVGDKLPEGKKSIAFSLAFRSTQKTLKYEEVDKEIANIILAIKQKFAGEIRE